MGYTRKLVSARIFQLRHISRSDGKFLVFESLLYPNGSWRFDSEIFPETYQLVYWDLYCIDVDIQYISAILSQWTSWLRGILYDSFPDWKPNERQNNPNKIDSCFVWIGWISVSLDVLELWRRNLLQAKQTEVSTENSIYHLDLVFIGHIICFL